ncbi:MAG: helix-turn-helix domain-containing protein [Christensenellales bacterium]
MIEKTHFRSKHNKEELLSNACGTSSFYCLYADDESLTGGSFPWHWHAAFEIDYVEGCDMQFNFSGNSLIVPQGNAVFINSGKIHSYQRKGNTSCKIIAFIFEPVFLSGYYNDAIYTRYTAPILSTDLPFLLISRETKQGESMIFNIEKMIRLATDEPDYYEILLRSELGNFWCGLMDTLKATHEFSCSKNKDGERMKLMLDFIHSHYNDHVSLKDIAASAMIGPRECSRCFKRSIKQAPVDYLNYYRIQMAIQQIVTTDKNITEISECNGFSSIGYFGKVFKQHTGLSPLQYRFSK